MLQCTWKGEGAAEACGIKFRKKSIIRRHQSWIVHKTSCICKDQWSSLLSPYYIHIIILCRPFSEGAPPAGNPAVCPAGTPRASQPITIEIPNKLFGPAVDPAGRPRALPTVGAPSQLLVGFFFGTAGIFIPEKHKQFGTK